MIEGPEVLARLGIILFGVARWELHEACHEAADRRCLLVARPGVDPLQRRSVPLELGSVLNCPSALHFYASLRRVGPRLPGRAGRQRDPCLSLFGAVTLLVVGIRTWKVVRNGGQ